MAVFPAIGGHAVAQYPSARVAETSTSVLRYVDGSEQRFRNRATAATGWLIRLADVRTEELFAIEAFFLTQQGQYGSFSFTDPWDGTEYPDCSFEFAEFHADSFAEGRSTTTLIIRNNQV
jgi:hypothetical protein